MKDSIYVAEIVIVVDTAAAGRLSVVAVLHREVKNMEGIDVREKRWQKLREKREWHFLRRFVWSRAQF